MARFVLTTIALLSLHVSAASIPVMRTEQVSLSATGVMMGESERGHARTHSKERKDKDYCNWDFPTGKPNTDECAEPGTGNDPQDQFVIDDPGDCQQASSMAGADKNWAAGLGDFLILYDDFQHFPAGCFKANCDVLAGHHTRKDAREAAAAAAAAGTAAPAANGTLLQQDPAAATGTATAARACYFFNPTVIRANESDIESACGTDDDACLPICSRKKIIFGNVNSAPGACAASDDEFDDRTCCAKGYEPIRYQDPCKTLSKCVSLGENDDPDFQVDITNSSEYHNFPKYCFDKVPKAGSTGDVEKAAFNSPPATITPGAMGNPLAPDRRHKPICNVSSITLWNGKQDLPRQQRETLEIW